MGYVREKYTKAYFTGLNADGTQANYGLEGTYEGTETTLRDFDIQILNKVNFNNANVLEIGFGRGESIQYVMNRGASSYVGVDFAAPAFEIAQDYLMQNNLTEPKIYCDDALAFLRDQGDKITHPIDIVLMLDVVEHIPRHELSLLFDFLKKYLSEKAVLVLNTPVYRFDNDVIADGIDERNFVDAIDHADFIEETKGMHCNKYTISSLQEFMKKHEYINITENHIYIYFKNNEHLKDFSAERIFPYVQLWNKAFEEGFPLEKEYVPDVLEFAYQLKTPIEVMLCEQPVLKGLKILGIPSVFESFRDDGALAYLNNHIKKGQIIFDVGSYVGLSSLYFAKKLENLGKVFCFEPNKYNLLRIKNNFSLNPEYLENIHLYDFGLSDKNEDAEMLLSDNIESGYASTSQLIKGGGTAIPKAELESIGFFRETIKLKTLDNFVEESGVIPNIIKVDIEGAEVLFLKGSLKTLTKHKPVLFIELHNVFSTCVVLQILRQVNYEFHVLSEEWGNRAQIIAVANDPTPIGLSKSNNAEVLFQSFSSYKAKLYQENLESFAKQRDQDYAILQVEHSALQAGHSALQAGHSALQVEHSALQAEHSTLQAEHSTLQAEHSTLQAGHSALQAGHSALQAGHSALQAGHSALQQAYNRLSELAIIKFGLYMKRAMHKIKFLNS